MAWFLSLRMPFYIGDQDPAYRYLPGFVDMASTSKTYFGDHPGVPLQIIGALLVKATYALQGTHDALVKDVLANPEMYLSVVAWVLLGLVSSSLCLLGFTALNVHGSLVGALMLQVGCVLVSRFMLYRLVGVTATAMLLGLTMVLMSLIILYSDKSQIEQQQAQWPLLFGLLLGTMVMTKLTVLPLVIIPVIILPSWKSRLYYFVFMSLIAFTLLHGFVDEPQRFWKFIWRTITRSDYYGAGNVGWDFGSFNDYALRVKKSDPLYILFLIALIGILLKTMSFNIFKSWSRLTNNTANLITLAICMAALGQWLVVAKQFRQYYLLPGSLMLVLAMYLAWVRWHNAEHSRHTALRIGVLGILLLLIYQGPMAYKWATWRKDFRDSGLEIEKHIQHFYPLSPLLSVNSSMTMSYALRDFRRFYSSSATAGLLIQEIYPQEVIIRPVKGQIIADKLADYFHTRPALVIVDNNTDHSMLNGLDLSFTGKYQSVYVLNKELE